MTLDIFHIDSFTETLFQGNPACVIPLEKWLPDDLMLNIAKENGVAETAFIVRHKDSFDLRWFTPDLEMDLCGHATLAAAHAIKTILGFDAGKIRFNTESGILNVDISGERYILDFPSRPSEGISFLPDELTFSLSIQPQYIFKAERDYILVYESESLIRDIVIDRDEFDKINLGQGGVAVTAPGENCDFVSRFFTPQATILEDFVTGSSHCSLVPYWSKRLSKKELVARQISARPGTLYCTDSGNRILIGGYAVTYSTGKIYMNN
ncbi:PhzF family phenazine biosynthesis protein [Dysgonomonas macrotermitis]|uniref:Phenazine biosynthesis protein PhzF family n=1 Tax=Dysgonomonas macrotermitis TaxID=1346286 RepID=A0A1M4VZQ2_9BACT|nr:PhzF family phenazine biosynthesis protein [Dysgonomonas macrotermitis]SHE74481.1 phenazine biosynthesis protein PhzF family [Dysgonomonas macrotermitis]